MVKGYLFALLSAVFLSSTIVLNDYLLSFANPGMLSFLFFASVFIGSGFLIIAGRRRSLISNIAAHWKDGVLVGGFNAFAATFFFLSLSLLEASTTAFIARFSTIFIILIGVFFLREKLTFVDFPGMALAVAGALLINYSGGSYTTLGVLVALLAALGVALHQVTAKVFVRRIDPLSLVNLRTFFSAIFLFFIAAATSSLEPVPVAVFPLVFVGGAFLATTGFVFLYKSFEIIDVSKAAVIRTADPFLVLLYGVLLFGSVPSLHQLLGGSLIVSGVAMIILKHRIRKIAYALRLPSWIG